MLSVIFACTTNLNAQNNYGGQYTRSFHDIMTTVGNRWNVRFKYNVDTVGLRLPYADFRVRPYSLEETLTNICKYFDFNWWKQNDGLYKIKPYEYPRRHTDEGARMLDYLRGLYSNRQQFEVRRDSVRLQVRRLLGIDDYKLSRPCQTGIGKGPCARRIYHPEHLHRDPSRRASLRNHLHAPSRQGHTTALACSQRYRKICAYHLS